MIQLPGGRIARADEFPGAVAAQPPLYAKPEGAAQKYINVRQTGRWIFPSVHLVWLPSCKYVRVAFWFGRIVVWRFGFGESSGGAFCKWIQWGGKPEGESPKMPWGTILHDASYCDCP